MLNIINKSPLDRGSLDSCLQSAEGGAILLIEDGVYAATKGSAGEAKLKSAGGKFKVYALAPDMEARGIASWTVSPWWTTAALSTWSPSTSPVSRGSDCTAYEHQRITHLGDNGNGYRS